MEKKFSRGWVLFGALLALLIVWMMSPSQKGAVIQKGLPLDLESSPVLGDPHKARVAIVQFSDYECPLCRQFHQETFNRLVKEYVDTGRAIFVFKEFPLPMHNPVASDEARAAQCVARVSDIASYVRYGRVLFEKTQLNGKGVEGIAPEVLAEQAGADSSLFSQCMRNNYAQDIITRDIAAGDRLGITGTPSFVIGKFENGQIAEGTLLVGNQPFAVFESVIERYTR